MAGADGEFGGELNLDIFLEIIGCKGTANGNFKVSARERTDLEFKEDLDANCLAKSLKTIAAFASIGGGKIVFGVKDRPRELVGVQNDLDEADIHNQLFTHLYPVPDFALYEYDVLGRKAICLDIIPVIKKPVIAIKDKQTAARRNETVLKAGTIYYRRSGKTKPISGEEFSSILDRRDTQIREEILNFMLRGKDVGFERAVIADFRRAGPNHENPTLYVPQSEAHRLNIIDRAKIVESDGAPAYQISGSVELTIPSEKDPRKPLLPEPSARVLKGIIEEKFGTDFPWTSHHLRKAANHLGYWELPTGDGTHTGQIEITKQPIYFEDGRAAIKRSINRNPNEFVETVGSLETIRKWNAGQH